MATPHHITNTLSLEIPPNLKLHVTPQQFTLLATSNRQLKLERSANGELSVNPPTGWETGERNISISGELYLWWRTAGKPGKIFDSSTGFTLPNGAILSPDAAWVSPDRWNALSDEQKGTFAAVCPNFIIELRSRSDSLAPLQAKMQEYRTNGTQLGWLIDPRNKSVEIYRTNSDVEPRSNPATLSGEDILSGFELNLSEIWG
jgi:Uma2 family endonuclease